MVQLNIEDVVEPSHYTRGEKDAIEFVKAVGHLEGFCLGNVIKYLYRYQFKDDPVKDLLKAKAYLGMLIGAVENKLIEASSQKSMGIPPNGKECWRKAGTAYWKQKEKAMMMLRNIVDLRGPDNP